MIYDLKFFSKQNVYLLRNYIIWYKLILELNTKMKYIAAYSLFVLGGIESPSKTVYSF